MSMAMAAVNDARVAEEIVDIVERVAGVPDAVDVVEVMDDEIVEETTVRNNVMQYVNNKKKFDLRFKKKVALIPQENKKLEKENSKDVWNAKRQNGLNHPHRLDSYFLI